MVSAYRLTKEKQYPVPHDMKHHFELNIDDGVTKNCTIIPWIHHDEAKLPSAFYTHPEHASFAEVGQSNVCAESRVNKMIATVRLSMSKHLLVTDNCDAVRVGILPIHGAFEDFDAKDELSGVTVGATLELTKETTDRQTYPIYDATKLDEKFSGSATLGADEPGLTTTQVIENVAFDTQMYYDVLNYYTIAPKLKKVTDGLRWITLTRDNPTRVMKFRIDSSTKRSNPYTFGGFLVIAPKAGTYYQIPLAGHVSSAASHVHVESNCRYLEWNDNFQHQRA